MKILIGEIVLSGGEEDYQSPYDISITNERNIQIVNTLRGIDAKGYDRGNQKTILEFKVSREHSSTEAAQKFVFEHAASLSGLKTYLTIIEEPSGDIFYLPNAVICSVRSVTSMNTTTHTYRIMGGNFCKSIN